MTKRPEGRKPLGRPSRRWEDNIKIDPKKWDEEVWTGLLWFRVRTGVGRL